MSRYMLISLPTNISLSNDREEALNALRSTIPQDVGTTYPFSVPTFKIGALDALINQADDLSKLCNDCENVVGKVGEALTALFEGDTERARSERNIDNSMSRFRPTRALSYWENVHYKSDLWHCTDSDTCN